jgi:hypothetical protein
MKASSSFSIKQLRDAAWTKQWGVESSIMDYGRNNYVAQPGDGAALIPKIGPYDLFATEWGYKPIPAAKTPEEEQVTLDRIASRQVDNPMLRFGNASGDDPGRQTEDLGDDGVEAGRLGFANIDRILGYLITATTNPGEDYDLLREMYGEVIGQRSREVGHILTIVGGVTETEYHANRGGAANYTPVPAEKQRRAVQFLIDNVFKTPMNLIKPEIISKIQPSGAPSIVLSTQQVPLSGLLSEARINRLTEQEAMLKDKAFTASEMVEMVRKGIFSEIAQPAPVVDLYRRNLQRALISALGARLSSTGELRSLARQALKDLRTDLTAAVAKTTDKATKAHLADCISVITEQLMPKTTVTVESAPAPQSPFPRRGVHTGHEEDFSCIFHNVPLTWKK